MISPSRSKMTASTVPNSADIWDRPTDVSRTVLLTIRVPGSHRQRTSGSLAGPCPVDCPESVPAGIGTDAPAVRALEAPLLAARSRARTPPRASLVSSRVSRDPDSVRPLHHLPPAYQIEHVFAYHTVERICPY